MKQTQCEDIIMADVDPSLIGKVISAIPYDQAFGAPLSAAIDAQVKAAKSALDFIITVGFTKNADGIQETKYAEFRYEEVDGEGKTQIRNLRVPFILLVNLPQLEISEGEISFDLEISQTASVKDHIGAEGSIEGKIGWGTVQSRINSKSQLQ